MSIENLRGLVDIFNGRVAAIVRLRLRCALLAVLRQFFIERAAGSLAVPGLPIYTDFGAWWAAGMHALHGNAAALYDPDEFAKIQSALFGPGEAFYPNWPSYPPTFFLVLAPLALLPYRFCVHHLGCGDIARLRRHRLSDRSAPSGNRPGTGRPVFRLEFSRRAKRVPNGIVAGRFAAFPRAPTGAGRRLYGLPDL